MGQNSSLDQGVLLLGMFSWCSRLTILSPVSCAKWPFLPWHPTASLQHGTHQITRTISCPSALSCLILGLYPLLLLFIRACAGSLCSRAPGKTYFGKVLLKLRLWTKDLTEFQIPDTFGSLSSAKTIILWSTVKIQSLKYEIHCYAETPALSQRPSGYKKGQRCPLVLNLCWLFA